MLEDINKYKFLQNGYITLPNVDDAAEFHNTIRSMKIMGFHDDEINCMVNWYLFYIIFNFVAVLRVVSAVLLLGNIEFKQEKNSDQATLPDDTGFFFIF